MKVKKVGKANLRYEFLGSSYPNGIPSMGVPLYDGLESTVDYALTMKGKAISAQFEWNKDELALESALRLSFPDVDSVQIEQDKEGNFDCLLR